MNECFKQTCEEVTDFENVYKQCVTLYIMFYVLHDYGFNEPKFFKFVCSLNLFTLFMSTQNILYSTYTNIYKNEN